MRIEKFIFNPVDQQCRWRENLGKKLKGAVHIETYTYLRVGYSGERTLVIFAFYPDVEE